MFDLSFLSWLVLATAAWLIGISKTALPGAGTISVALFAAVLPARMSTAAMLLLLIIGDLLAIYAYRRDADWKTLRALVPPVLVGITGGALFLNFSGDLLVKRVIGIILLTLVALTLLLRWRKPAATAGRGAGIFYGTLGGFTTMAANAGGPVMSLYFLSARFGVTRFLGTAAWFFFMVNIIKLPFSAGIGLIGTETLVTTAALAPLVVTGAVMGRLLAGRMTSRVFDPLVLGLTALSSVALLL